MKNPKITKYLPRLVDEKINRYLKLFGAILIEGPSFYYTIP